MIVCRNKLSWKSAFHLELAGVFAVTGLCHLPALGWLSLLEMGPARVRTEKGKWVSRQITHLERLLCVCLHWMLFLEGNSCSISCRKRGLFIQFKWKEQNQEEWSVWGENCTWLCWNCRAWFENKLHPVFVVLGWERREREINPFALVGSLWVFPPLPFPHGHSWQGRGQGWASRAPRVISRLGIDAF